MARMFCKCQSCAGPIHRGARGVADCGASTRDLGYSIRTTLQRDLVTCGDCVDAGAQLDERIAQLQDVPIGPEGPAPKLWRFSSPPPPHRGEDD